MTIDQQYLIKQLMALLAIPSPVGFTDEVSDYVTQQLDTLSVAWQKRRRGTIVATLSGESQRNDRAICAHLDTLGAMVTQIKANGRCRLRPIGTWSARFAEGARVSVLGTNYGGEPLRGSIIPEYSSGHVYGDQIDALPIDWTNVELRIDAFCNNPDQARELGVEVGSLVGLDPNPEISPDGYISSRYLDNKAGVACLLTAIKAVQQSGTPLAVDCHPVFTLSEETGCGSGHAPDSDVGELLAIDIGPIAEGQNSSEHCVNIGMMDTSGVYHQKLTNHLRQLCVKHDMEYRTDTYKFYRSDTHSSITAGHDLLHGLVTFGTESTHGYERTHLDSLIATTQLIAHYISSTPIHD